LNRELSTWELFAYTRAGKPGPENRQSVSKVSRLDRNSRDVPTPRIQKPEPRCKTEFAVDFGVYGLVTEADKTAANCGNLTFDLESALIEKLAGQSKRQTCPASVAVEREGKEWLDHHRKSLRLSRERLLPAD
jgi:hypothetical protein